MMTRSIGDLDLKPFGVTSQPDIKEVLVSLNFTSNFCLTFVKFYFNLYLII